MELSKRLQCIANQVTRGSSVADIGTDHGYIPIYLYQQNRIIKGIAMDIGKGPLEKAKMNIHYYKASSVIETRQSDGLEKLQPGEVDTIIIAGMGGLLIQNILARKIFLLRTLKRLILQPQKNQDIVRYFLHKNGFQISNEHIVKEEGHFYTIITAVPGEEKYKRKADYLFGKKLIEEKNALLKEYISEQLRLSDEILKKMQGKTTEGAKKRREEVIEFKKVCREVLTWL